MSDFKLTPEEYEKAYFVLTKKLEDKDKEIDKLKKEVNSSVPKTSRILQNIITTKPADYVQKPYDKSLNTKVEIHDRKKYIFTCEKCKKTEALQYSKWIHEGENGKTFHYTAKCDYCNSTYGVEKTREIYNLVKNDTWMKRGDNF